MEMLNGTSIKYELTTCSPEETQGLGINIGSAASPGDIYLLVGTLGTGKTCLTQGIAWGLGIREYAVSPSFVLVRELHGRLPLYHIDLYRLGNIKEIMELGLEEYLHASGVCVIEWAERGLSILPAEHLLIEISYLSDTGRCFQLLPRGKHYLRVSSRLKSGHKGDSGCS
jgi:tRNA threonylcarbamoyladenosine biosynthesis protein TsaE